MIPIEISSIIIHIRFNLKYSFKTQFPFKLLVLILYWGYLVLIWVSFKLDNKARDKSFELKAIVICGDIILLLLSLYFLGIWKQPSPSINPAKYEF